MEAEPPANAAAAAPAAFAPAAAGPAVAGADQGQAAAGSAAPPEGAGVKKEEGAGAGENGAGGGRVWTGSAGIDRVFFGGIWRVPGQTVGRVWVGLDRVAFFSGLITGAAAWAFFGWLAVFHMLASFCASIPWSVAGGGKCVCMVRFLEVRAGCVGGGQLSCYPSGSSMPYSARPGLESRREGSPPMLSKTPLPFNNLLRMS